MKMNESSNPGLDWLAKRQWWEVTREERYFCAELYGCVQRDIHCFISFLQRNCRPVIGSRRNWEIAYEVCFYRDWLHAQRNAPKELYRELSRKRTFDLALFSDSEIVIFETKAHQCFASKQLKTLPTDRERVVQCTGIKSVHTAGIISSLYRPRASTLEAFTLQPLITWEELARLYGDQTAVFERADAIYGD